MDLDELFWEAEVEEIKKGFIYDDKKGEYICLICGDKFKKGIIYPNGQQLLEAEMAIKLHLKQQHGGVFSYLVNMNKKYTGLTETQQELIKYFYQGLNDREIVEKQGGGSRSTIRSHRFKLKQKEKQARVFLAIMELLAEGQEDEEDEFINIHRGATMIDERYAITNSEKEKVLKNYFKEEKLKVLPAKEKKKIIVFQKIIQAFERDKEYTEKEVNQILKNFYEDHVTIRRYLIEYGFLARSRDCSSYWVKL